MPFSIQLTGLNEVLARANVVRYDPAVRRALQRGVDRLVAVSRELAPEDTGALKASITGQLLRAPVVGGYGYVGSSKTYALPVHEGRTAGARMPPSNVLVPWLERHGMDPRLAFVVARAIGRRGISARPFLTQALERTRDDFNLYVEEAAREVERLWAA